MVLVPPIPLPAWIPVRLRRVRGRLFAGMTCGEPERRARKPWNAGTLKAA